MQSTLSTAFPSSTLSSPILERRQELPALPGNYESLSAVEKKELIWNRIKATGNSSQDWNSGAETALLLVTLPPRPPFDRVNDEMVKGRKKFIRK